MSIKSCIKFFPVIRKCIQPKQLNSIRSHFLNINSSTYSLCNKLNVRLYSTEPKKDTKPVYYGILTPQIKAVKIFSLSSSIVGIIAQPFMYTEIASTGNVSIIVAAYSCIGFFTVVTPILLHMITKKYITHLDYRESTDTYIAKTVSFFCRTKETEFSPNDVVVPDVPGMFTTFHVKGKGLFLDPRLFEQPEHYAKIMGFDKPLDFKLYQTSGIDGHDKKE